MKLTRQSSAAAQSQGRSDHKALSSLSSQLQHIELSEAAGSETRSLPSLLNLSTDVLLNLLVTMVDLKSLSTFSFCCKYARFIISHTRILEIVAQREWNILTGSGLGELAKQRIGLHSFLQLKQWEHRLCFSMRYRNVLHKISDQFLFEDGNQANMEEAEGSMRIPSHRHFDASVNLAVSCHEDDAHVYVWALPSCARLARLNCEAPPLAVAVYNNRAVTLERVPLPANDTQFRLKLKLWTVPGSGTRQCACVKVLSPPANFPFQIVVTAESIARLELGGGGATIAVLSSWAGVGAPFVASYRCCLCHLIRCETGQLLCGPHVVAASYDASFFNDYIDWRGYKRMGVFHADDPRLLSSSADTRRPTLAAGIHSYVSVTHALRQPPHGGEALLRALWIQEFSYASHAPLFAQVAVLDASEFEGLLGPVAVTDALLIESDEYRAKHLLVLLDAGWLLEYDLAPCSSAQEEYGHLRALPSDGNVWNKHQGAVVCMRVLGRTLVTLGADHSVRTWDLFSGLCGARVIFPGLREGFTPVGLQVCRLGLALASTNNQEDGGEDFFGECHLHLIDFTT